MQIIDLIDSPVISCPWNKTIRIRKSGEADDKNQLALVALERTPGALIHIVIILAQIYIVRNRIRSRHPAKGCPWILM